MKPGWHSRGYLPHFDGPNVVQAITFRLADSLPKRVVDAWQEELHLETDEYKRRNLIRRTQAYLDGCYGECLLGRPEFAQFVEDSLLHFDADRYLLLSWVIMPNHVHVLVEIADDVLLGDVVWGWKQFSARQINRHRGRAGRVWHRDYFDRYIRDSDHLNRTIRYIEANPVKAGLVSAPEQFRWSSARYHSGQSPGGF